MKKKYDYNFIQLAIIGTALIALLGLVGYIPGLSILGSINSKFIPMAPSTSVSFIFLSAALFVYNKKEQKASFQFLVLCLTILTTLFGLLEIIGFFIDMDLNFEDKFIPNFGKLEGVPIARMSPSTGGLFFLSGIALLFLFQTERQKGSQKKWGHLAGSFSSLIVMSAAIFFLGYLYGTPFLYNQKTIPMALTTTIGFGFLGVGITLAVGVNFFPLNQMYGVSTRVQLMKVFLPLVLILILAQDFTSKFLHSYFNTNTALSAATLIILSFVITGIIIKKVSIIVGNRIDQLEDSRKKSESALRESENKFRSIFENSPLAIVHFDKSGITTDCNDNLCGILGSSKDKIIGLDTLNKISDKKMVSAISDALSGKKAQYEGEYISVTGSKTTLISAKFAPIYSYNKMVIGAIGILEDITDRVTAQKEKIVLEKQLQQSQKMESIGNLAGGIAHDFNNLLYPIIGFAEMLKEDLPSDSPEHESAQEIFNAGRRGGELVKQILAFSRQTEHKLSPICFQRILTEVCKLTRSTIPSDIKIHQDIQKDCGLVIADATQLHQIAMNLITNAYHAVEKASGEISVQLKEIMLDSDDLQDSLLQAGQYAMLSVSDNGVGIPREIRNNIFEPYFTTKEKGKGTGLGLAVVYGILTEHKGDIKVYSEVGKGTTFNVYLPLMKKSTESISTEKELNKLAGTERILLVDDEKSVVRLEKQMLERLGYNVSARSNSLEALETFHSNPDVYDLVISDMTMPNMTGDQLAKEILSVRSDIPVIICTGFSERINKEQAEEIGVNGFLMKPVTKSEMAQMVRKVLDKTII